MYTPSQIGQIVKIPLIAWPTILLTLGCIAVEVTVFFLLHNNLINCYLALGINTIIVYGVFTPMHDASHGSVASRQYSFLNSVIGNLAGFCFPVPFPAFKHIHLMHHKHTNEEEDPDKWAGRGPFYLLPFRWMTIEIKYYTIYLPKLHTRPIREAIWAVTSLIGMITIIYTLYNNGYDKAVVWAWILPGRLATAILACFFDYLPHRPHIISKKENPYIATNVTSLIGTQTSILTWPLLHQNYHNIHHLAPYIPFYMYSTVWNTLKSDLIAKGTKIKPIL